MAGRTKVRPYVRLGYVSVGRTQVRRYATGAVGEGNGILGHVLGSKDVSRAVAAQASSQTGLSSDVMKQMLPLVATLVMGAMARRGATGTASMAEPGGASSLLQMLGGALDQNRNGSALDDIAGMIGKRLGRS